MDDHSPALDRARARFYRQLMALGTFTVLLMYTVSDSFVFDGCRPELGSKTNAAAQSSQSWLPKISAPSFDTVH